MTRIFFSFFLLCGFIMAGCCLNISPVGAAEAPIQIEADHMSSTEKSNTVLFTGNVDAKQKDVRIRSNEMTVYYTPPGKSAGKKQTKTSQQVEKLICTGNVEVSKSEWLGTSNRMIYLAKERQVILLENAKAFQGQNRVSGEKIIYYLDEGRSEVVGKRTSATVGGANQKENKSSRVNMTIIQK